MTLSNIAMLEVYGLYIQNPKSKINNLKSSILYCIVIQAISAVVLLATEPFSGSG